MTKLALELLIGRPKAPLEITALKETKDVSRNVEPTIKHALHLSPCRKSCYVGATCTPEGMGNMWHTVECGRQLVWSLLPYTQMLGVKGDLLASQTDVGYLQQFFT